MTTTQDSTDLSELKRRRKQRIWRFAHNVLVHPAMEVLPVDLGNWLHDVTGELAFGET